MVGSQFIFRISDAENPFENLLSIDRWRENGKNGWNNAHNEWKYNISHSVEHLICYWYRDIIANSMKLVRESCMNKFELINCINQTMSVLNEKNVSDWMWIQMRDNDEMWKSPSIMLCLISLLFFVVLTIPFFIKLNHAYTSNRS